MAPPVSPRVAVLRADASVSSESSSESSSRPSEATLAALFAALADGHPHPLARLAADAPDGIAGVVRALEALRALDVPVEWTAETAVSRRCTALDAAEIERRLADERPVPSRWNVRVVWSTASTNTDLLDAARRGGSGGSTLLCAEVQHDGRGRLGRRWSSAPGASLTMSLSIRVPRPLSALAGVTLVCGLAVQRVLRDDGVGARLKWPNDIVVDGAKLVGILVEAHAGRDGTTLVVGVGINVTGTHDAPVAGSALPRTDLERCGATSLDRNRLAAAVALAIARDLAEFATNGFAPFASRWNAVDAYAGTAVTIAPAGDGDRSSEATGIARGVDETGALCVDTSDGPRRIVAGDVSLRPVVSSGAVAA